MQIKGNIDSLDQNDKEKFDKLLSNRMENARNNTYGPLSQEEYTLKEHQQRAYKLLKYLSEYSNEEKNAHQAILGGRADRAVHRAYAHYVGLPLSHGKSRLRDSFGQDR